MHVYPSHRKEEGGGWGWVGEREPFCQCPLLLNNTHMSSGLPSLACFKGQLQTAATITGWRRGCELLQERLFWWAVGPESHRVGNGRKGRQKERKHLQWPTFRHCESLFSLFLWPQSPCRQWTECTVQSYLLNSLFYNIVTHKHPCLLLRWVYLGKK